MLGIPEKEFVSGANVQTMNVDEPPVPDGSAVARVGAILGQEIDDGRNAEDLFNASEGNRELGHRIAQIRAEVMNDPANINNPSNWYSQASILIDQAKTEIYEKYSPRIHNQSSADKLYTSMATISDSAIADIRIQGVEKSTALMGELAKQQVTQAMSLMAYPQAKELLKEYGDYLTPAQQVDISTKINDGEAMLQMQRAFSDHPLSVTGMPIDELQRSFGVSQSVAFGMRKQIEAMREETSKQLVDQTIFRIEQAKMLRSPSVSIEEINGITSQLTPQDGAKLLKFYNSNMPAMDTFFGDPAQLSALYSRSLRKDGSLDVDLARDYVKETARTNNVVLDEEQIVAKVKRLDENRRVDVYSGLAKDGRMVNTVKGFAEAYRSGDKTARARFEKFKENAPAIYKRTIDDIWGQYAKVAEDGSVAEAVNYGKFLADVSGLVKSGVKTTDDASISRFLEARGHVPTKELVSNAKQVIADMNALSQSGGKQLLRLTALPDLSLRLLSGDFNTTTGEADLRSSLSNYNISPEETDRILGSIKKDFNGDYAKFGQSIQSILRNPNKFGITNTPQEQKIMVGRKDMKEFTPDELRLRQVRMEDGSIAKISGLSATFRKDGKDYPVSEVTKKNGFGRDDVSKAELISMMVANVNAPLSEAQIRQLGILKGDSHILFDAVLYVDGYPESDVTKFNSDILNAVGRTVKISNIKGK